MIALNRTNLQGRAFRLVEVFSPTAQTSIRTDGKQIIVDCSIRDIAHSWHLWVMGRRIQDAFPFLTSEQQMFLQQ